MKKKDQHDKTWRQLVDFVLPKVLSLFGWTYDAVCECFRAQMVLSAGKDCVQEGQVVVEGGEACGHVDQPGESGESGEPGEPGEPGEGEEQQEEEGGEDFEQFEQFVEHEGYE